MERVDTRGHNDNEGGNRRTDSFESTGIITPNVGDIGKSDKRKYSSSDSREADKSLRSASGGVNINVGRNIRFFPFFSFRESGRPKMIIKRTDVILLNMPKNLRIFNS